MTRSKNSPEPSEPDNQPTTATADPGPRSETATEPANDTNAARYEPYPGSAFFHGGRHSPIIAAAGARLTQEGHAPAGKRLGPDWTNAHRAAWASYQKALRPKESGDVSGIPDQTAWDQLKVSRVSPLPKES
ncbi:hypothetical protein ACFC08_28365 [Streptomyces sp. NPDC056112]|uniref:hypothetical protein n=1 Tax=Streptomyces sp. NPDC056112 TaxID=3345715 RepID=UPI0035D5C6A8